jgi:DMSO/TMAO reductase YedYZ molybdopterin-dependent catalytic subunit
MTFHQSAARGLAALGCAAAMLLATPLLAQPSAQVTLTGELKSTLVLSPAELRAFPQDQQVSFAQARGAPGQETRSVVRGVRLTAVIGRAGLKDGPRDDWKTLLVIATATDGYRAVFGWPELTNTAIGEGVLLVYERDGQPLDSREGQIALLSTADRRLGARHVRNIVKVELRQLGP